MTNNELFDKHVKDRLGDYSPPVPPHIWEQIAAEREKRKPAGFWVRFFNNRNLLLLAAMLLAGGTGAWFWTQYQNSQQPATHTATVQQGPASPAENGNTSNNESPNTGLSNNTSSNNNNPATDNKTSNNQQNPLISTDPSADSKNNINLTANQQRQPGNELANDENAVVAALKKSRTKGATTVTTIAANPATDEENNLLTADDFPSGGTLLGRLNYIAERIAARKIATARPASREPYFYLPDCPALEKNASGNKKYLEVYAGPDYAFRSFKDTGNSVYLQKRKESTQFSSAFSAGIRYTRVFKNSMSVRAGVNYSQINEKFTYVQGNLVQVTYIIDANGDTTGSYITTGSRYKTTHNKYHSIDVPVMVGYEFGNGRIHANISAGPVVNIYSWQKGEVLDTALKPVTITTGKGSTPYQFKTNAGVGFMGSVSVYYKLNDHVHIMAEPYYRYNFSQMNKENLTLKQKFSNAGIRVGVRVDLP